MLGRLSRSVNLAETFGGPAATTGSGPVDNQQKKMYAPVVYQKECGYDPSPRRSLAGNAGSYRPENTGCAGPATWVRHCPASPTSFRGLAEAQSRDALSSTAAPGTARQDYLQMGHFRQQSQGQILFADAFRP